MPKRKSNEIPITDRSKRKTQHHYVDTTEDKNVIHTADSFAFYEFFDCTVYHDNQKLNLCAQHAINSVLQRPAFNQRSLDIFAGHLFEHEQAILKTKMKNSPYHSEFADYSIEVIEQALDLHDIKLLRVFDDEAIINAKAFIIHCSNHWISLRKIDDYWIDLDSKLIKPKYLPEFDINAYINSMEGHSQLFIVKGDLPSAVHTFSFVSEEGDQSTELSHAQSDDKKMSIKTKRPMDEEDLTPSKRSVTDGAERRSAQLKLSKQRRRACLDEEKVAKIREKNRVAHELSRTKLTNEEAAKFREKKESLMNSFEKNYRKRTLLHFAKKNRVAHELSRTKLTNEEAAKFREKNRRSQTIIIYKQLQ